MATTTPTQSSITNQQSQIPPRLCPGCRRPLAQPWLVCRRCWFRLPTDLRLMFQRARRNIPARRAAYRAILELLRGK